MGTEINVSEIIFEINETELITDKADKPASNEQQKSDDDLITSFDELKEFTRPKEKTLYEHLKTLHNYAKKLHDFLKKFSDEKSIFGSELILTSIYNYLYIFFYYIIKFQNWTDI